MKKGIICFAVLMTVMSASAQNLNTLHDLVIRFYGYQRAGLKSGSANNLNSGFTNASHGGDNYNGSPLDGGWYDAGDYIKFGMPFGYAVYCLLKGYDIFPSAYADSYKADNSSGTDGIPDVLNQVKFATDYLIKAVINESTIILDVGMASEEHQTWGVVNAGGRDASKCLTCSGADIPATYAACLALMSTVYRKYDAAYADECLAKAKVAFKFAKKKIDQGGDNNLYCKAQKKGNDYLYFYYDPNDGKGLQQQIGDKMAAAGVELYRATNDEDPIYKTWARRTISEMYNCMSYSFIGPLASFEVWRRGLGGASSVFENVGFVEKMVQTEGPFKGVYKNSGWGTARDVGTAAFVYALGYVTTSTETKRADYLTRAKDHIAWVSGTNSKSQSYIVGFGSNAPSNIHYRSAAGGPKGGVVSGPSDDGSWSNDGSAENCEVALDYNAGIVGAIAFLKALENPGTDVKITTPFAFTPEGDADLTTKSVTFKVGFSSSVEWTLTVTGGSGSKKFTGTGTTVSQVWDGSADQGFFLSGEMVAVSLTVDKNIVAYDILKVKALNLFITKAKKLAPSTGDVLVDDFDDGDSLNKISGKWQPIGDQTSYAGKTKLLFTEKMLTVNGNIVSDAVASFAGVRSTFNATGAAQSIGAPKTVVCDLYSNKVTNVTVELEQPGITDGAYYSMTVPVTTIDNTYRLEIAKFKQPDWKTVEKPLDLNAISAIRFVMYDSISKVLLYIDNVSIESLSTASVTHSLTPVTARFSPVVAGSNMQYIMPQTRYGVLECTVFDIAGKTVLKKSINAAPGTPVSLSLSALPSGMYTVSHTSGGVPAGEKVRFTQVR